MLILLEGPDGAGKTTLATKLAFEEYAHHGPYTGATGEAIAAAMGGSLKPALLGKDLVVDRCWVSDPIYSPVFRGHGSRICPEYRRMLDREALAADGVIVLCQPSFEVCAKAFNSGREEMLDNEAQLRTVYDLYRGPLDTCLPTVKYDYTQDKYQDLLLQVQRAVFSRRENIKITLVCSGANTKSEAQAEASVPYVAFNKDGTAFWLANLLEAAGISESSLHWLNAYDGYGGEAYPEQAKSETKVVALGPYAANWCANNGLSYDIVPLPWTHLKWYPTVEYPLIKLLKGLLE